MITLPKGLQITRLEAGEKFLNEKARAWVEGQGGDRSKEELLHASDCLDPRMAYFGRKFPQPIADRLVPVFLIGRILHAFIICAVEGKKFDLAADGGSHVSKPLGITFSPDMFYDERVREIKTSRSFYEPKDIKDLSMYCEQLLIYFAGTNTTKGDLWVLYMNIKGGPAFRVYEVSITKDELKQVQDEIKRTTALFKKAFTANRPDLLPQCRLFKCGKECHYWEQCKPEGRYGVPKTRWKKDDESPLVRIAKSSAVKRKGESTGA